MKLLSVTLTIQTKSNLSLLVQCDVLFICRIKSTELRQDRKESLLVHLFLFVFFLLNNVYLKVRLNLQT